MNQFREPRKVAPPIMGNHDESEEMSLIIKPLMDYVSTINSLQGIDFSWNSYVAQVKANGADRYVQMSNDIFGKNEKSAGLEYP